MMLHWGYNNWTGVTNASMAKRSNSSQQATITLPAGATLLNMAFYNQSGTWDSKNSSNYNLSVS